jgi:hypothetical protein
MPRESYQQGTADLRHGARVHVVKGPDQGAVGKITSVLLDRGVIYYQVEFLSPDGALRASGGLFGEAELEPAPPG